MGRDAVRLYRLYFETSNMDPLREVEERAGGKLGN